MGSHRVGHDWSDLAAAPYHAKAHSGPNSGAFILKMSDNQKETSKGPIHFEGRGEVWGQKHKLKVNEKFFYQKRIAPCRERVHIVHYKSKEFQDAVSLQKAQRRVIKDKNNNQGNEMWAKTA